MVKIFKFEMSDAIADSNKTRWYLWSICDVSLSSGMNIISLQIGRVNRSAQDPPVVGRIRYSSLASYSQIRNPKLHHSHSQVSLCEGLVGAGDHYKYTFIDGRVPFILSHSLV
jgi:hypothetical protein